MSSTFFLLFHLLSHDYRSRALPSSAIHLIRAYISQPATLRFCHSDAKTVVQVSTKSNKVPNRARDHVPLHESQHTQVLNELDAQRSAFELVAALNCHKKDINDIAIFNRAMQKCGDSFKDYRSVQAVMDIITSLNHLQPDVLSFNIYIHHMALSGSPKKCISALHRMINDYALTPDQITFSAVIKALRFRNLCAEAEKHWIMMRDEFGLIPHDVLYCEMISCYSKAHRIKDAVKIFNEYLHRVHDGTINVDVAVFNAVLNGYSRCGDIQGMENTVHLFQQYGLELNVNSMGDIMRGYIRGKRYLECVESAQQWINCGQIPNQQMMTMKCVAISQLIALCNNDDAGFKEKNKLYLRLKHVLDSELIFYGIQITPRIAKTLLDGAIMLYSDDRMKVVPIFESLVERKLLRYTIWDRLSGRECIDLHLFTVIESRFIIWYVLNFKLKELRLLGEKEKDLIVIVGKGNHSDGDTHGRSTLALWITQYLLTWNPPIHCKDLSKVAGRLVIDRKELLPYFK